MTIGYLTISIDDGHPLDLKAANLLSRYEMPATFYIPVKNSERPVMDKSGIQELSNSFEIGAHTFNHRVLTGLSHNELRRELIDGKDWLEEVLGMAVQSFCYPKGKFNSWVAQEVRRAGFLGARTCMHNLNIFPSDPFSWGLSTQAYSHSRVIHLLHALKEQNFRGILDFYRVHRGLVDWVEHFKRGVRHVLINGGIAHLYFHSWEIEEQDDWGRLEGLFQYLSRLCDLTKCTNGELYEIWYQRERYAGNKEKRN